MNLLTLTAFTLGLYLGATWALKDLELHHVIGAAELADPGGIATIEEWGPVG